MPLTSGFAWQIPGGSQTGSQAGLSPMRARVVANRCGEPSGHGGRRRVAGAEFGYCSHPLHDANGHRSQTTFCFASAPDAVDLIMPAISPPKSTRSDPRRQPGSMSQVMTMTAESSVQRGWRHRRHGTGATAGLPRPLDAIELSVDFRLGAGRPVNLPGETGLWTQPVKSEHFELTKGGQCPGLEFRRHHLSRATSRVD